jgi:hypothetical protein
MRSYSMFARHQGGVKIEGGCCMHAARVQIGRLVQCSCNSYQAGARYARYAVAACASRPGPLSHQPPAVTAATVSSRIGQRETPYDEMRARRQQLSCARGAFVMQCQGTSRTGMLVVLPSQFPRLRSRSHLYFCQPRSQHLCCLDQGWRTSNV